DAPSGDRYQTTVSLGSAPASTVQIVDDNSTQGFSTSGSWVPYSGQGYLNAVHYISVAGTGANVATWTFTVSPGQYRVSATWSELYNRASNAPYTVLDGT